METLYIFDARHLKDGVIETSNYHRKGDNVRVTGNTVNTISRVYRIGHSIFETWEEAAAKAYRARDKKCDTLKTQIEELMAMDFYKRTK